ncbi:hypothetical protein J6S88_06370 [bacterium]|nr:hypothetical protein [bacterium]
MEEKSPAEEFVSAIEKSVNEDTQGKKSKKYFWSPTAAIISFAPLLGYETFSIAKLRRLTKAGNKDLKKAFAQKSLRNIVILLAVATALCLGLEYLFSRNSDKKVKEFRQDFADLNTETEAKLRDQIVRSSYIGAMCSSVSEEITVNYNLVLDPITRRRLKKLVKHELVHAKQYETIARSENGINKLNYAVLKSAAKLFNNPKAIDEFEMVYQELNKDTTGKFDNMTLHLLGADVDFKRYFQGIHELLTNKDAGIDDLPMVIDVEHYKKVIDKKGALTPEEADKAEKYYEAMLDYPPITFWRTINPFSSYYDNLLEREAYKENPNFATFVRNIFGMNKV